MILVDVFPLSAPGGNYCSQVYSGLFLLHQRGDVRLRFRLNPCLSVRAASHVPTLAHLVYLETRSPGKPVRKIWIDLHDGPELIAAEKIESADCYFKRTFVQASLEKELAHKPDLLQRVRPYGLFQTGRVDCEFSDLWRGLAFLVHTRKLWKEPIQSARRLTGIILGSEDKLRARMILRSAKFNDMAQNSVIFQSRLFDSDKTRLPEATHRLNELRKGLVEALRTSLSDQFTGGLVPGPHTPPELHSDMSTNRSDYLEEMGRHSIAVVTQGLDGSIPEKLAEALSMGQCVVIERFAARVFPELCEGKHALFFTTPEECVAQCQRLLQDTEVRESMRMENFRLYQEHVQPMELVRHLLTDF